MATKYQKQAKEKREKIKIENQLNKEVQTVVTTAVSKMIDEEKFKLKDNIKQRKKLLLSDLKERKLLLENEEGIIVSGKTYDFQEITDRMSMPIMDFGHLASSYNPIDLAFIYSEFCGMYYAIRKHEKSYTPSLDTFLSFSGVSRRQYDKWRANAEYEEITSRIDVFLGSAINDSAMKKQIDSRTAEIMQKADLQKRDRDEVPKSITNIQNNFNTTDEEHQLLRASLLEKLGKQTTKKDHLLN